MVSSLSGYTTYPLSYIPSVSSTSSVLATTDLSEVQQATTRHSGSGGIYSALANALSESGITLSSADTTTTDTSSTISTADTEQAVGQFIQVLMAAMHSMSAPAAQEADTDAPPPPPPAAISDSSSENPMQTDLNALISQLASSSSSSTSSSSGTEISDLQSAFSSMLASLGQSSSNATLSSVLQNFASTLSANQGSNMVDEVA
ncbi:hemagglutinin [Mangrovibacter yixingensis]|uniref:hemagglutinin n=1 Tax=Mangrovibacter yixingensis TaxID=1529639 RepID=UPI001CFC5D2F|nr:hemagglutinin [Mangrovibacter yixingensis]